MNKYERPLCQSIGVGTDHRVVEKLQDSCVGTEQFLCDSCLVSSSIGRSSRITTTEKAPVMCHVSVNTEPIVPGLSIFSDIEKMLHSVSRGTSTTVPSTTDSSTDPVGVCLSDSYTNTVTPVVSAASTATDVHMLLNSHFLCHASTSTDRHEMVSIGFNTETSALRPCTDAKTDTSDILIGQQALSVDCSTSTDSTEVQSVGFNTDSIQRSDVTTETKDSNALNITFTVGTNTDLCSSPKSTKSVDAVNTMTRKLCDANVLTDSCTTEDRATITSFNCHHTGVQVQWPCYSIGINTESQSPFSQPATETSSKSLTPSPERVDLPQISSSCSKLSTPQIPMLTLKKTVSNIQDSKITQNGSTIFHEASHKELGVCSADHVGSMLPSKDCSLNRDRQETTADEAGAQQIEVSSSEDENVSEGEEEDSQKGCSDFDDNGSNVSNENRSRKKIDFTKPRPTRAFALSKAAAAKKLLTSQGNAQISGGGSLGNSPTFARNTLHTRSMRVDSRKGDSLAYITDRNSKGASKTANTSSMRSTSAGKAALKADGKGTFASSSKLQKTIRLAKPSLPMTKADLGLIKSPTTNRPRTTVNSSDAGCADQSQRVSACCKDEEAGEAGDTVGPLPSDRMKTTKELRVRNENDDDSMAAETSMRSDDRQRSTQGKFDDSTEDRKRQSRHPVQPDAGSSSESEVSLEEGSYDLQNSYEAKTCDSKGELQEVFNGELANSLRILEHFLRNPNEVNGQTADKSMRRVQQEWLKAAARKNANAQYVEQFIDELESFSTDVMAWVVNACDENENTALHYAVSYGNFDVVSVLLDSKVCNLNKANKVGYTAVMLGALCDITNETNRMVIQRLFQMGDVNVKADQHGQTALMLAVSQNKIETVKLLIDAGAGVNMQDDDGSTALMCAAEHGHKDIVSLLLAHPDIDASLADNDGSTALSIAVDSGYKNIGVLIYAHLNYGRNMSTNFSKRFFKSFGSVLS